MAVVDPCLQTWLQVEKHCLQEVPAEHLREMRTVLAEEGPVALMNGLWVTMWRNSVCVLMWV